MTVTSLCHSDCGCEVANCCLACPLPKCKYENQREYRWKWGEDIRQEASQMRASGLSISQVATRLGVSYRSAYRWLSRSGINITRAP